MLLATPAATSSPACEAPHRPEAPVGMKATPGASMPARFMRTSSPSVFPLRATRHAPIVTRTPMKTARTGVK